MDKKDFKKVVLPELIKIDDKNKEICGEFISLEKSEKFDDSMQLIYIVEGKKFSTFLNQMAVKLFNNEKVKQGDLFILSYTGMTKNQAGTQEYKTFELYVKN